MPGTPAQTLLNARKGLILAIDPDVTVTLKENLKINLKEING